MNHPILLLYNFKNEGPKNDVIRLLCVRLGIKVRPVTQHEYAQRLSALAGMEKDDTPYTGAGFADEMLVFVGFTNELLDAFLQGYRGAKIPPVPLKAVLTQSNALWNSLQLREELLRENEAIRGRK